MSHILVVDDDMRVRDNIKKYAQFEGYEVTEADNGIEAIKALEKHNIDIIIMDVMMPELDGYSATKEIRKTSDVPIIILSARTEEFDKIHGFECGCDDYVTKPYSVKELMMRVAAQLKRSGITLPDTKEIYKKDGFTVDFSGRLVTLNGKEINLSPREYSLLFYLIKNRGIALSREKILSEVWGYDFLGDDRTIDTHIKQLRHQLKEHGSHISTLRGIGYRYNE